MGLHNFIHTKMGGAIIQLQLRNIAVLAIWVDSLRYFEIGKPLVSSLFYLNTIALPVNGVKSYTNKPPTKCVTVNLNSFDSKSKFISMLFKKTRIPIKCHFEKVG